MSARFLNSTCFAKEYNKTLVREFYSSLDEDISYVGSSFHGVIYVRKKIVDFNVEELSTLVGILVYQEIEGSGLNEEVDMD